MSLIDKIKVLLNQQYANPIPNPIPQQKYCIFIGEYEIQEAKPTTQTECADIVTSILSIGIPCVVTVKDMEGKVLDIFNSVPPDALVENVSDYEYEEEEEEYDQLATTHTIIKVSYEIPYSIRRRVEQLEILENLQQALEKAVESAFEYNWQQVSTDREYTHEKVNNAYFLSGTTIKLYE